MRGCVLVDRAFFHASIRTSEWLLMKMTTIVWDSLPICVAVKLLLCFGTTHFSVLDSRDWSVDFKTSHDQSIFVIHIDKKLYLFRASPMSFWSMSIPSIEAHKCFRAVDTDTIRTSNPHRAENVRPSVSS